MSEPTLNPETEREFDETFESWLPYDGIGIRNKPGYTVSEDLRELKQFIAKVEQRARQEVVEEETYIAHAEMRKRCLLFGCVFGIPQIDKEPRKECMFCGEPNSLDNDFWFDTSPVECVQKAVNKIVKKHKALSLKKEQE